MRLKLPGAVAGANWRKIGIWADQVGDKQAHDLPIADMDSKMTGPSDGALTPQMCNPSMFAPN